METQWDVTATPCGNESGNPRTVDSTKSEVSTNGAHDAGPGKKGREGKRRYLFPRSECVLMSEVLSHGVQGDDLSYPTPFQLKWKDYIENHTPT